MSWTCEQTEARLSDYLDGLLQPVEQSAFNHHVNTCEKCAPLVAGVARARRALRVGTRGSAGAARKRDFDGNTGCAQLAESETLAEGPAIAAVCLQHGLGGRDARHHSYGFWFFVPQAQAGGSSSCHDLSQR